MFRDESCDCDIDWWCGRTHMSFQSLWMGHSSGAGSVFGSSQTFAVKIISKVDSTNVPPSILICLLSKSKHVVLAYLFPNFVCYASNGVSWSCKHQVLGRFTKRVCFCISAAKKFPPRVRPWRWSPRGPPANQLANTDCCQLQLQATL